MRGSLDRPPCTRGHRDSLDGDGQNSLTDQQREEFDSRTQEVIDLNKSLSFLRIVPTRWPKVEGQKAMAIFQIYSAAFEKDQELGRGPGIFGFDSRKYWPLKGDYQGNIYDGKNERLNSEIVDLICQAIDRAVNQGRLAKGRDR